MVPAGRDGVKNRRVPARPPEVRRIERDEWQRYKQVRLAALAQDPDAFGSTHAREAASVDEMWIERTTAAALGEQRITFVADDGGPELVGLVGGWCEPDGTIELISMWTSPAVRRTGVGRALVAAVLAWAGDRLVSLWFTEGNDAARRLYEEMGFVATGEVQPFPNDPSRREIRMTLRR
jgi:GNAT superfamily N-acetyltransferase